MSKKGWRWFDRIFLFGAVSLALAIVVNTTREFMMDKGYFLPDEQKRHLKDGASYVREKFDKAKITPANQETVSKINIAKARKAEQPVSQPRRPSFSERVGDPLLRGGGQHSPLGNPLRDGYVPQMRVMDLQISMNEVVPTPKKITTSSRKGIIRNQNKIHTMV